MSKCKELIERFENLVEKDLYVDGANIAKELHIAVNRFAMTKDDKYKKDAEKLLNKFSPHHLIMDYLQSNKSFINFIDELLSAEKNGFSYYTTSNLKIRQHKEIWIEGECLMSLL